MSNARDKANIPALNFSSTGIDDNATSTAVTIDSSGDVGINNTAPNLNPWNKAVTLSGTNNAAYELAKGSTLHGAFGLQGDNRVQLINFQSADITFNTTSSVSERMRITSAGNVGIGTSSPENKLDVRGIVNCTNAGADASLAEVIRFARSDYPDFYHTIFASTGSGTSSDHKLDFRLNTGSSNTVTSRMTLLGNGNVGIGTSSPAHNLEIVATNAGSINDSLQIRNNTTTTGSGSRLRFITSTDLNSDTNGASIASVRNGNDNDLVFEVENSEAMRIDHAGNVGIGTSSPANTLHLFSSAPTINIQDGGTHGTNSSPTILFKDSSSIQGFIDFTSGGDFRFYQSKANNLLFGTQDTERMRITSSGKALFNTTTNNNGMVISNGTDTSGNNACFGMERSSYKSTMGMSSTGSMHFKNFSGEVKVEDSSGNVTTVSPHNFSAIPNGASEDLAWSYYSRKGDEENDFDNTKYISADITKVIRKVENLTGEKLIYTGTGSTDDGSTVSQNIIQDLITRIESLEAEVTALKNQP